jgi:hypothetical protein
LFFFGLGVLGLFLMGRFSLHNRLLSVRWVPDLGRLVMMLVVCFLVLVFWCVFSRDIEYFGLWILVFVVYGIGFICLSQPCRK